MLIPTVSHCLQAPFLLEFMSVGGSRKNYKVQNKVHGPFTLTNIRLEESSEHCSDLKIWAGHIQGRLAVQYAAYSSEAGKIPEGVWVSEKPPDDPKETSQLANLSKGELDTVSVWY